jgi:CheY-like chemotaxis protein
MPPGGRTVKKILVCEDDPDMAKLVMSVIEHAGHELLQAANGREAVEMALKEMPDLVLMDLRMPEMDGFAATRVLRDKGYKKPIVIVTASDKKEDREKALKAGCNEFLVKNIVMSGLESALFRLLPYE